MLTLLPRKPVRKGCVFALASLTVATACSRLLGVDGEYELRSEVMDSGVTSPPDAPAVPRPPPGDGPGPEAPPPVVPTEPDATGAGGTPAAEAGPHADAGEASVPPEAGPGVPDAPAPTCTICPLTCTAANYLGTVTGRHKIANIVLDVWAPIKAGIELSIEPGAGPLLPRFRGTLLPDTSVGSGSPGVTLYGRLEGTLDCTSRKAQAQIVAGARTAFTRQNIDGSFSGELGADGTLSGTFTEWEVSNAALSGSGTWSASRVSP